MRAMIVGGVLATGLLMGCGGVESDVDMNADVAVDEQSAEVSQQAAPMYCNNERFTYTFYSDATYTTVVGTEVCKCWALKRTTGYATPYWTLTGYAVCPGPQP